MIKNIAPASNEQIAAWEAWDTHHNSHDDVELIFSALIARIRLLIEAWNERSTLKPEGEQISGEADTWRENIARLLWERFSPEHEVDWPSTHSSEYRRAADDIVALSSLTSKQISGEAVEQLVARHCAAYLSDEWQTIEDTVRSAVIEALEPKT